MDGGVILFLALFLLGYGWNLGFVAGSALLTRGLGLAERTRVEGLTDSLIWSSAAAASLGSGVVVAAASYTALGLLGAAMIIVPAWLLVSRRRAVTAAGADPGVRHELASQPRQPAPGARLDLGDRDVLVGAVGDPDVAGAEHHARRSADVDEHPHVGAVGLAEERRPPAGHVLDGVGKTHRKRVVRRDTRRAEPAAGDLDGRRVIAQELVTGAGSAMPAAVRLRPRPGSVRAGRHSGRRP